MLKKVTSCVSSPLAQAMDFSLIVKGELIDQLSGIMCFVVVKKTRVILSRP